MGVPGNFSKAESARFVLIYWLLKRSATLIQEFSELISLCVTWYRKMTFCSVVYVKFRWTNKQNRGWHRGSHWDLKQQQQQQKTVLLRLRKTVKHLRENEEKRDSEFSVTNTEQPLLPVTKPFSWKERITEKAENSRALFTNADQLLNTAPLLPQSSEAKYAGLVLLFYNKINSVRAKWSQDRWSLI